MSDSAPERLLVCYVPGLDIRRVDSHLTPYLSQALDKGPCLRFLSLPAAHRVASMLTGAYPHEHGFWGPKLRPDWRHRSAGQRLIDRLPDVLTTTAQCVRHVVNGPVELATIPPHRRRRFEWMRFTMKHVSNVQHVLRRFERVPTIFQLVGEGRYRYVYAERWSGLAKLLANLDDGQPALELLDVHCLDRIQHWNPPGGDRVAEAYRQIDAFVEALHGKCRRQGVLFMIISDHGMEPVKRVVDLRAKLAELDLPPDDYDLFLENVRCTFWFHTAEARGQLTRILETCDDGVLVSREGMGRYGIHFEDDSYGHAYFYAHPGASFFPNDFHQRFSSVYLGLTDAQQRRRVFMPQHLADHGYLPHHACELGFMVLADDRYGARADTVELLDLAPTFLALIGQPKPSTMRGESAFRLLADEPGTPAAREFAAVHAAT